MHKTETMSIETFLSDFELTVFCRVKHCIVYNKQLETHVCIISIVTADATIIHNADDQLCIQKAYFYGEQH